jgi:uncharacterized alkaline shock family protein YloU
MIRLENNFGLIEVSPAYFNEIIGGAVRSCFGVAGMAEDKKKGPRLPALRRQVFAEQGVRVFKDGNGLMVDLHILIHYGMNISATVQSIVHKVRYTVEEATGIAVRKVNVFVDGVHCAAGERCTEVG